MRPYRDWLRFGFTHGRARHSQYFYREFVQYRALDVVDFSRRARRQDCRIDRSVFRLTHTGSAQHARHRSDPEVIE